MGMTAAIAGGAQLIGGMMQADTAKSAAGAQERGAREAMATQERMLQEQKQLQEPFRAGGMEALNRLLAGTAEGGQFQKQLSMAQALPQFQPFKAEESQAERYARSKALDAMRAQAAMGGQALSSQALAGAGTTAANIAGQFEQQAYNQWLQAQQEQYRQAMGSQELALQQYQTQVNPLLSLAGLGQSAASGVAGDVGRAGQTIGGLQTGIGNVQAAGQIGAAAGMGQALGGLGYGLGTYFGQPASTGTSPSFGGGQLPLGQTSRYGSEGPYFAMTQSPTNPYAGLTQQAMSTAY